MKSEVRVPRQGSMNPRTRCADHTVYHHSGKHGPQETVKSRTQHIRWRQSLNKVMVGSRAWEAMYSSIFVHVTYNQACSNPKCTL